MGTGGGNSRGPESHDGRLKPTVSRSGGLSHSRYTDYYFIIRVDLGDDGPLAHGGQNGNAIVLWVQRAVCVTHLSTGAGSLLEHHSAFDSYFLLRSTPYSHTVDQWREIVDQYFWVEGCVANANVQPANSRVRFAPIPWQTNSWFLSLTEYYSVVGAAISPNSFAPPF